MKIALLVMTLLLFAGCTTKELVYIKPKPFNFIKTNEPKVRKIRIYKDDVYLYHKYIKNLRDIIKFHNDQIKDYEKSFKKE